MRGHRAAHVALRRRTHVLAGHELNVDRSGLVDLLIMVVRRLEPGAPGGAGCKWPVALGTRAITQFVAGRFAAAAPRVLATSPQEEWAQGRDAGCYVDERQLHAGPYYQGDGVDCVFQSGLFPSSCKVAWGHLHV